MFSIHESKIVGNTVSVPNFLKNKSITEGEDYKKLEAKCTAEESYRYGKLNMVEADTLNLKFADHGLNLIEDQWGTVWQRDGDTIVRVDDDLSWIDELQAKKAQRRPQIHAPYEGPRPLESLPPRSGPSDKSKEEPEIEKPRKPKQHSKAPG